MESLIKCRIFHLKLLLQKCDWFSEGDQSFNTFQPSGPFRIETNHLICSVNQMTGFYMKCTTGLKWVNCRKQRFHTKIFTWNIRKTSFSLHNCFRKPSSLRILFNKWKKVNEITANILKPHLWVHTLSWIFKDFFCPRTHFSLLVSSQSAMQ